MVLLTGGLILASCSSAYEPFAKGSRTFAQDPELDSPAPDAVVEAIRNNEHDPPPVWVDGSSSVTEGEFVYEIGLFPIEG
jgi:hypothetical protein